MIGLLRSLFVFVMSLLASVFSIVAFPLFVLAFVVFTIADSCRGPDPKRGRRHARSLDNLAIDGYHAIMTTWTVQDIEARRATGDALVTVGDWCCSTVTGEGPGVHDARLSLYRSVRYQVVERDPRDGEIFASGDEAECYALNAGRLQWYRKATYGLTSDAR